MYKYILFDWDGTLAKTLHVWLSAYKKVFNEEEFNPSDEEIVSKAFSQREKGMENIGSKNADKAWMKVVDEVNNNEVNVELYPNAIKVLDELTKKGYKLALLTQSDRNTVMPAIEKRNLDKYFEVILTKDDVVNKKPDPEIFLKALEKMSGNREDALIIGDSYHDIRGGKNAATDTVAFYPKENEKFFSKSDLEKENPTYLISNLKELIKIVK